MIRNTTSARRLSRAAKLLRDAGWYVAPPVRTHSDMRDQCEYPERREAPGDCCTNLASRQRKTSRGTLWLCTAHFDRPEAELFDERLACHAE